MNKPSPDIQNEVMHACKALRQADFVPREQLEIIATDVFLRVTTVNDGCEDTTLINRIRAEILDYVSSLGIKVLPIRRWVSQRLDGPVNRTPPVE
mgnify:CR=1 FL=1